MTTGTGDLATSEWQTVNDGSLTFKNGRNECLKLTNESRRILESMPVKTPHNTVDRKGGISRASTKNSRSDNSHVAELADHTDSPKLLVAYLSGKIDSHPAFSKYPPQKRFQIGGKNALLSNPTKRDCTEITHRYARNLSIGHPLPAHIIASWVNSIGANPFTGAEISSTFYPRGRLSLR